MKRLLAALLVLSVVAPGAVGAQAFSESDAALTVEQPNYVSSDVEQVSQGSTTTYQAEGARLLLQPQNFDQSQVVDFGVGTTADATLSRESDLGVYQFTAGQSGTYEVFWLVEEQREVVANNTTAVQDVRVRYSARLNVSRTNLDHVDPATLEQQRRDAANWSAFASAIRSERVAGPDANLDRQTKRAISLIRLAENPFSALTGNFTQILVLLVASLGGLIALALGLGWYAYSRYYDVKELREYRKLDSERADLEEQLEDLETRETLATLEGMDWNHLFPDDVARAFRDGFGETVLDGWLRLQSAMEPRRLVRDRLQAMSDDHVAVVDNQPTASDGGEPASGDRGASATLYPGGEQPEDANTHDLGDPPDWLVDAIDWTDPELVQFDMAAADLDHEALDTELDAPTIDELVERFDIQLKRDFDGDKEQFAEYVAEFLRSVADHDMTDRRGQPKQIRMAANVFLRASRILRDRHQFPAAAYPAEYWELVATRYSTEDEVSQYVSDVQSGRIGGD